jgi:hypothetical protein
MTRFMSSALQFFAVFAVIAAAQTKAVPATSEPQPSVKDPQPPADSSLRSRPQDMADPQQPQRPQDSADQQQGPGQWQDWGPQPQAYFGGGYGYGGYPYGGGGWDNSHGSGWGRKLMGGRQLNGFDGNYGYGYSSPYGGGYDSYDSFGGGGRVSNFLNNRFDGDDDNSWFDRKLASDADAPAEAHRELRGNSRSNYRRSNYGYGYGYDAPRIAYHGRNGGGW